MQETLLPCRCFEESHGEFVWADLQQNSTTANNFFSASTLARSHTPAQFAGSHSASVGTAISTSRHVIQDQWLSRHQNVNASSLSDVVASRTTPACTVLCQKPLSLPLRLTLVSCLISNDRFKSHLIDFQCLFQFIPVAFPQQPHDISLKFH